MKSAIVLIGASCIALSAGVGAQSSSPPPQQQSDSSQRRPDARYPNPSGQDSNPSSTRVEPAKRPPSSKAPQDSSRGAAADHTYQDGKKRDVSPGCSTPTDASSAGVDAKKPQTADGQRKTVCTTSGATGHSAKEPRVASEDDKAKKGEKPKADAQPAPQPR